MNESILSLIIRLSKKKTRELLSINDEDNNLNDTSNEVVDQVHSRLSNKEILKKELLIFNSFNEKEALNRLYAKALSSDLSKKRHFRKTLFTVLSSAAVLLTGVFLFTFLKQTPDIVDTKNESLANNNVVITTNNGEMQAIDSTTKELQIGDVIIKNNPNQGKLTQSLANEDAVPTLIKLQVPYGKTYKLELPDGTVVRLNSKSNLSYFSNFTSNNREVTLHGEAYFDVAKSANMPFVVNGSRGQVTVLGTQFNIKDYWEDPISKVTLVEGSVSISNANTKLTLAPGNRACLDNTSDNIKVEKAHLSMELAWLKERFDYKDLPLEEVVKDLNRWYNKNIAFETTDISQIKVTLSIGRAASIENVVALINNYSGLSIIELENNSFLIKKIKRDNFSIH